MSKSAVPVLRLKTPAQIVCAVPYLLGFEPEASLVLIAHSGDRRTVRLTLRIDLLPTGLSEVVDTVVAACQRAKAGEVSLIVFPDGPAGLALDERGLTSEDAIDGSLPWSGLVDAVSIGLLAYAMPVVEAICVRRTPARVPGKTELRWFSYICANVRCCPRGGTRVTAADRGAVAPIFVAAGAAILPNREAVADRMRALPAQDLSRTRLARAWQAATQSTGRPPLRFQTAQRVADMLIDSASAIPVRPLGTEAMVNVLEAFSDVKARDVVMVQLVQDRSRLAALIEVLCPLIRAAPDSAVAPVAAVTALLAWFSGHGALAWVAIDRSLTADPDQSLAQLVATALQGALPPHDFAASLAGLDLQTCWAGNAVA